MDILKLIDQLNALGEQERIEAKSASKIGKSILETVCAFANEPELGGGYLLLGISQTNHPDKPFQIIGVTDPEKLQQDLVSQCRTIFNKPISIEVQIQAINGSIVIGIFVPEVTNGLKPIYFKNRQLPKGAYRRMGSSDVQCTEDDLSILYCHNHIESYDLTTVPDTSWNDIDEDAIENYRNERRTVNPNASELQLSDQELLKALGCIKNFDYPHKITVAGIMLFGTKLCFRRLFADMRIEYLRVPGTQWMCDPEVRYTNAIDIRGPLLQNIRRAEATIIDDLPAAFSLPEGSLQRKDIPAIPYDVIREAVVNAVMHRDYRAHQAIQIIRYANRIEIRNPGYSLIAEEHLGEPGSKTRNLKLAEVLRDTNFSEKKGTGIRKMQLHMREAGLSPPLFESDRSRNLFVATFLFHHFLTEQDMIWLANFKSYQLSDEQAKALIFVREVGAINNSAYRNLCQLDTLTASQSLGQLRNYGLITAKDRGVATYYVPTPLLIPVANKTKTHQLKDKTHQPKGKTHQLKDKSHQLKGKTHQITEQFIMLDELPNQLQEKLKQLGKKASQKTVRQLIIELCQYQMMSAANLIMLLQRGDKKYFVRTYLTPLIEQGILEYEFPQMPMHPQQRYRIIK